MTAGFDARSAAIALRAAVQHGQVSVAPIYGVEPGSRAPCPIHGGDNPTSFEVYDDGGWRCHSQCQTGGDAVLFVAIRELGHVVGHPLRGEVFIKAVERTLDLLNVDASTFACARAAEPPRGKKKAKPYPPANEVSRLLAFAHDVVPTGDIFSLGGRPRPGIGTCAAVAGLALCVVLGPDTKKHRPKWAARWPDGKLFPLYDARGALASVQLRPDDPDKGKSKNPARYNSTAWLMNAPARALIGGESRSEKDRARLLGYANARESALTLGTIITEGVPAFCAWSRWHPGPVIGLPGQAPTAALMGRIPREGPVLIDVDPDLTGLDYLREILAGLVHHDDVRVSRRTRWIVEHAKDAAAAPDATAFALEQARKADPTLRDPDELADGPRVERHGFEPLAFEERVALIGRGEAVGRAWVAHLRTNAEGHVLATEGNLLAALQHDERWRGVLGYNERAERTTFLRNPPVDGIAGPFPREVRDEDAVFIGAWYETQLAIEFKNASIHRALLAQASTRRFDLVREYLGRVAASWDGTARIDSWLTRYFGAPDTDVVRTVGRKWLISAVARAMSPGCKADHVLVLEGEQGAGKSTGLKALCADEAWFCDNVPELRGNKDAGELITAGPWIVELAELDAIAKSESSAVKAFLTRTEDAFRPAYGRYLRRHPRRIVFCASTNDAAYLRDSTGNRRFWPVRVGDVDVAGVARVRDQLWGEAVHAYRAGEAWHIDDPDILRELAQEQESRREVDPWETPAAAYLESYRELALAARRRGGTPLRIADLPGRCLDSMDISASRTSRADGRRINAILRSLGWDRVQRRDGEDGRRRWAWEPLDRWFADDDQCHQQTGDDKGCHRLDFGGSDSSNAESRESRPSGQSAETANRGVAEGVSPGDTPSVTTNERDEKLNDSGDVTSVTNVTSSPYTRARDPNEPRDSDPPKALMGNPVTRGDAGDGGSAGDGGDDFDDAWSAERCAAEDRW